MVNNTRRLAHAFLDAAVVSCYTARIKEYEARLQRGLDIMDRL